MNGLGQIGANSPKLNQANGNGLGNVVQPKQEQQTFGRNSSLEMFELANAERMKAKEMQFENEAMRAKGEQQRLAAENNAMRENQILEGLKNGQQRRSPHRRLSTQPKRFCSYSGSGPFRRPCACPGYPRRPLARCLRS